MGQRGPLPANFFDPNTPAGSIDLTPPAELDDIAAAEWNRIVPELHRIGRINTLDRTVLILYCQSHSEYHQYDAAVRQHGLTYVTPSGQVKARPEVLLKKQALNSLMKCASELGFSPNARHRLNLNTATDPSTLPAGSSASLKEKIARAKKGDE